MMEKELTRLWYEYLKRSDSYRDFIKTIRPITKAMRNPAHCANLWRDSGKDQVLLGHLRNLQRFGDVFKVPFEKWYDREHKPWAAVETKNYLQWIDRQIELQDKNYCKASGLPYLPGKGMMATVDTKSIYDDQDVLRRIIETPGRPVVNITVNPYASDKEIRDTVMRLVKQHKKKVIPALESLTDYRLTYDEYQKGLSEADIAKAILPKQNNFVFNEAINRIRLYYKNACTILRNVEAGNITFPGKY
ncbi:MAG: hypothetical protein ACOYOS_08000 [Syntrophales bacterium]